jgi:hypothetical protein
MEQLLYALLLAVHNLALVATGGGLFILWLLVRYRLRLPQQGLDNLDHGIEKNVFAHPQGYLRAVILLTLTGGGLPLVHYLYHGDIQPQTLVSLSAFGLKGVWVFGLVVALIRWLKSVELPLAGVYAEASRNPSAVNLKAYFTLAAAREAYLKQGWLWAMLILLTTPFVTYFQK